MAFTQGGKIVSAEDVSLNQVATGQYLEYNTASGNWTNTGLAGKAALVNQGGLENVSTQNANGSFAINLANGNVFVLTLTGATTLSVSGATNQKACSFTLYLKQDGTGNRAVTWPNGTRWAGGAAPTLSTAANAVDILVFESVDGGSNWYGSLVGTNFS